MVALAEQPIWRPTITRIETNEPVVGGEGGISNRALLELADRTAFLKQEFDGLLTGNFALQDGDYVQLRARATTKEDVGLGSVPNFEATSSLTDGSTTKFATAKATFDLKALVDGALKLTGGTSTGNIFVQRENGIFGLVDPVAAVNFNFRVFGGIPRIEGAVEGEVRVQGEGGGNIGRLTVRFGGVVHDVYHEGNLPITQNPSDGDPAKVPSAAALKLVSDELPGKADIDGDHTGLRARATTKSDVGLSDVPNYPATSSITDGSAAKFATAAAVKTVADQRVARPPAGAALVLDALAAANVSDVQARIGGELLSLLHKNNLTQIDVGQVGATGWIPLFGGLILQWGQRVNTSYSIVNTQVFPIAFPTAPFVVVGSATVPLGSNEILASFSAIQISANQFTFQIYEIDGDTNGIGDVSWIALGH